jgi:ABC-2 type transport system ATP-binding protein
MVTSDEWAVDLQDVRKTYAGKIHALRGVDLRVGRGEIFGLLGPNGAGKSTLVKIIMTIVRADRAAGRVLGAPLGHRRTLARVGYLPEAHRFPGHLTGLQLLDFYAALAKVPSATRRQRAPMLLERVGMARWGDMRLGKYSKGMLQRLGLAQALMNDPELVVLDEPTDGLDPIGRRDVRQLLVDMCSNGKTVFLNSHLLSELEMVCDRVAILVQGGVARQGTLDELAAHTMHYRVSVADDPAPLAAEISRAGCTLTERTIVVPGQDLERVNALIDLVRSRGCTIESVAPHRSSLEDILVQAAREATDPAEGG